MAHHIQIYSSLAEHLKPHAHTLPHTPTHTYTLPHPHRYTSTFLNLTEYLEFWIHPLHYFGLNCGPNSSGRIHQLLATDVGNALVLGDHAEDGALDNRAP